MDIWDKGKRCGCNQIKTSKNTEEQRSCTGVIFRHGALKLPELLLLFVSYLTNLSLKCLEYNRITGSKQCELTALCGDNQEPVNMGFIVFEPVEISSTHYFINKY